MDEEEDAPGLLLTDKAVIVTGVDSTKEKSSTSSHLKVCTVYLKSTNYCL